MRIIKDIGSVLWDNNSIQKVFMFVQLLVC